MYALVEYKGKQYKAEKDALIQVDKIDLEEGKTFYNPDEDPFFKAMSK